MLKMATKKNLPVWFPEDFYFVLLRFWLLWYFCCFYCCFKHSSRFTVTPSPWGNIHWDPLQPLLFEVLLVLLLWVRITKSKVQNRTLTKITPKPTCLELFSLIKKMDDLDSSCSFSPTTLKPLLKQSPWDKSCKLTLGGFFSCMCVIWLKSAFPVIQQHTVQSDLHCIFLFLCLSQH